MNYIQIKFINILHNQFFFILIKRNFKLILKEAFAYGVGNIVTSFFKGFPACVALSRSAILDGVGGKTQIFALVSSALMLVVCLAVGPLFRTLPSVLICFFHFKFYFIFHIFNLKALFSCNNR